MGKRRSSRELALKFLYQFELNEGNVDEQMNSFIELNSLKDEIEVFMKELVEAVIKQKTEIDEIIQKFSENWLLDRMTVIDRNILRIGTCELLSDFSTPPKVVINEFINGILDKIYKEIGHKKGPLSFTG
jgi:N utilization substance protein B